MEKITCICVMRELMMALSDFENKLMDLSVNLSLEESLDLGWEILADCFEKDETGIKSDLTDEFWPVK